MDPYTGRLPICDPSEYFIDDFVPLRPGDPNPRRPSSSEYFIDDFVAPPEEVRNPCRPSSSETLISDFAPRLAGDPDPRRPPSSETLISSYRPCYEPGDPRSEVSGPSIDSSYPSLQSARSRSLGRSRGSIDSSDFSVSTPGYNDPNARPGSGDPREWGQPWNRRGQIGRSDTTHSSRETWLEEDPNSSGWSYYGAESYNERRNMHPRRGRERRHSHDAYRRGEEEGPAGGGSYMDRVAAAGGSDPRDVGDPFEGEPRPRQGLWWAGGEW